MAATAPGVAVPPAGQAVPYQGGPAVNLDYGAELGQARAVEILNARLAQRDKWDTDVHTGCWLWQTGLTNTGRVEVKRYTNTQLQLRRTTGVGPARNSGYHFQLHRVAYLARHGRDVTPGNVGSHRCEVPNCFNPDHVLDESQSANLSRKNCAGVLMCADCPGHIIADLCSHQIKCIRPPRNVNCCLARYRAEVAAGIAHSDDQSVPSRPQTGQSVESANTNLSMPAHEDLDVHMRSSPEIQESPRVSSALATESSDPVRAPGRGRVFWASVAGSGFGSDGRQFPSSSPRRPTRRLLRGQSDVLEASLELQAATQETNPLALPGAEFLEMDNEVQASSPTTSSYEGSSLGGFIVPDSPPAR